MTRSLLRQKSPRESLRQQWRGLSRGPAEKVSVGINGGPHDDAVVSGGGILIVELPRCRRRIDSDVGVVDPRAVCTELDAADVSQAARSVSGNTNTRDMSGPSAGRHVRLRQRDDQVGRAELPASTPSRRRRADLGDHLRARRRRPIFQRLEFLRRSADPIRRIYGRADPLSTAA